MINLFKYVIFIIVSLLSKYLNYSRQEKNAILFINTGQIGDLVISSLILENDLFFHKNICYLLIDEKYYELFSGYNGNIKILSFNKKKYKYLISYRLILLKKLNNLNIKYSYNITAARGFLNDEITLLSGAEEYYAINSNERYLGKYYLRLFNKRYSSILFEDIINEYEKTVKLICKITNATYEKLVFENKKTFLVDNRESDNNKYIAISPFASNRNKEWGEINYKYLIENLSKKNKIVLLGTYQQKKRLEKIKDNYKNVDYITNNLSKAICVINNSLIFIGNDSGLTHISYRLGKITCAIIGGGGYGRFSLYKKINNKSIEFYYKLDCFGCNWECLYRESYCLTKIDKNIVLKKIQELLSNEL